MGFLQNLVRGLGPRRKQQVAPTLSNYPPQENYQQYTRLPNLPMGTPGDYTPDPYRLHAPFIPRRGPDSTMVIISNAGTTLISQGDETVEHVPDQPLQQHFNQKQALPPQEVLVPAHGVVAPAVTFKRGWSQQFVPQPGMYPDEYIGMPAIERSSPLNVVQAPAEIPRNNIGAVRIPSARKGHS